MNNFKIIPIIIIIIIIINFT